MKTTKLKKLVAKKARRRVLKRARPTNTVARFIKLDAKGKRLPANANAWDAVLDTTTNLIWSRTLPVDLVTQPEAVKAASEHVICGKTGRLPTRVELLTLVDDTRHSPAIDTAFFPNCKSNWYWTATRAAPSPGDYAWIVSFNDGGSSWNFQTYYGFFRAVRAGQ